MGQRECGKIKERCPAFDLSARHTPRLLNMHALLCIEMGVTEGVAGAVKIGRCEEVTVHIFMYIYTRNYG